MNFYVGQKVVCIDDHFTAWTQGEITPRRGNVYTIRNIKPSVSQPDKVAIRLVEIVNTPRRYVQGIFECGFLSHRFRPLEKTKDQSFFMEGAPKDSRKWDNHRKIKVKETA